VDCFSGVGLIVGGRCEGLNGGGGWKHRALGWEKLA